MSCKLLFDTNVLIDVISKDSTWFDWSDRQLARASGIGKAVVNPIIAAELAPLFESNRDLVHWLSPEIFHLAPLPYDACWLAGQAFLKYRKAGGTKTSTLPDFFIGAHAECAGLTLVTRDAARYRSYFPSVRLITP